MLLVVFVLLLVVVVLLFMLVFWRINRHRVVCACVCACVRCEHHDTTTPPRPPSLTPQLVQAGETGTITIRFEVNATTIRDVYVDNPRSSSSSAGQQQQPPVQQQPRQLSDILILRVLNGADSFVVVQGSLKPTCFGRPLDSLLLADESAVAGANEEGHSRGDRDTGPPLLIPR